MSSINFTHTPYGDLAIISMRGCEDISSQVDFYLKQWRNIEDDDQSFVIDANCPRFGTGEAKAVLHHSARGLDAFIICDCFNYSVTYKMYGQTVPMSPDDHFQDLKRIIAAFGGKARRISVIMPMLYEGRQHRRTARESMDCAMALQELVSMGVKNIITFDAHDPRVNNAIPLDGFDNVKIINGDILKVDLNKIIEENFAGMRVAVCANLPYYITSPVIMKLLESRLPISTIAVMVQKEAADRLCAEVGSRAAGAVTVAVNYYAEAQTLFGVPRTSFLPPPNVDSAVIKLTLRDMPPVGVKDEKLFFQIVKACFAQRRKILINTVCNTLGLDKNVFRAVLNKSGIPETVRGEALTMQQLASIANALCE